MPTASPDPKPIFLAAVDIADPSERAAFLNAQCGNNDELRRRVDALIRAHDEAGSFMQPQTGAYVSDARSAAPNPDATGTIIAAKYKLIERIGEGGMGSVWMAQQSEPVKRLVAVKLIKAGMDSKQVIARFEAERQALAVMDHPNIAKILDGGIVGMEPAAQARDKPESLASASGSVGRPFFVMELVKGVPITDYCDAKKLTPRERLELFIPVCQAIQHAHQKGIIHRDIKPSNVLIAPYDDKPVPKVIDFGLAKATGVSLIDASQATNFGGVVGTPQYMSPEQASLNNLDIDTRSDIYSLGVLLYELLTGCPPFSQKELEKAGVLEMLRVIREQDPPRPSTKLSTADALPSISANRGTEPKKLTGLLRNELDWIVMKALEKDRSRRFETANGFAADINRYLAGEPVAAHPPSAGYRFKKFVRRNRPQVIAASLVFVALMAGLTATLWQSHLREIARRDAVAAAERVAEEKKKVEVARADAQAKEAEANAVVKFFEDKVFSAGRPKGEAGGLRHQVSLRDAIKASLPALGTSFRDQPLVEARLRLTLGKTFAYLGEYAQAAEQFEQTCALSTRQLGPDHPNTLSSLNNLANIYAALNRHTEALKLREETLAARKRVLPPDHPDTLASMNNLALSYWTLNRHAEALKLREETLDARKRVLSPDHPDTLMSMNNLAISYATLNRHAEALNLFEATLAGWKRVLGPDHPDTLKSMNDLAIGYANLNRLREALKLHDETLACRKRVLPAGHPEIAISISNIACVHALMIPKADDKTKQADLAMDWLQQAVAAGYKNVEHMKRDPDLDPLRDRDDFKKLIADLEKASAKPAEKP